MEQSVCLTSSHVLCLPAECRGRCAVEVIDELLAERSATSGEEADLLLDLRWKLGTSDDAEGALRLFCDLRRRMEGRQYLAFFRILTVAGVFLLLLLFPGSLLFRLIGLANVGGTLIAGEDDDRILPQAEFIEPLH